MTLGSELASELEKPLSVETSCVLPEVHVGLVFGFPARLEFHVGYVLILDIGVFQPLVRGECLFEVSMCCDHKAPTCCNLPILFHLPFRKKGGKSSQCTAGHVQQRSFPT